MSNRGLGSERVKLKFTDHPNLVWFVTEEVPMIDG